MLTDAKVRAAKSRAKPYKLTDANRLYLLVTPSGGKLWRWNYDYYGKPKSMAFGAAMGCIWSCWNSSSRAISAMPVRDP